MKQTLRALIRGTPLEQAHALYSRFIAPGELTFDVGANRGNRAKVFCRLGARVIAVEPQTACADWLRVMFARTPGFHLVREALGSSPGRARLMIGPYDAIASLSTDWIQAVTRTGRFGSHRWEREETVRVETLDRLIARYGIPAFIKIDVEGFEHEVLAGLSTPVAALSVEITHEFIRSTFKCIDHLRRIAPWEFQISLGESMEFALPRWVAPEEIGECLTALPQGAWGDLYARSGGRPAGRGR